jgi:threonine/homoserine/homoserine lactone efflux protein
MLDPATLALFTVGSLVIIISPGPDFFYVSARGMSQGRLAGLLSAAGTSIGLLIHTMLAVLGLSALLKTSELAFLTVKTIGALYLVFMAVKVLSTKDRMFVESRAVSGRDWFVIVRDAIATNVFNPKAILTFVAYIPQFIRASDDAAGGQMVFLGVYFAVLAALWFGFVGYCAGAIGTWLARRRTARNLIRWLTAAVLLGLGVRLAGARQAAR